MTWVRLAASAARAGFFSSSTEQALSSTLYSSGIEDPLASLTGDTIVKEWPFVERLDLHESHVRIIV